MTKHPTLWARARDRRWTTVVLAVLCIALVAWTLRRRRGEPVSPPKSKSSASESPTPSSCGSTQRNQAVSIYGESKSSVAQRVRLILWARAVRVHKIWPDRLRVTVRRDEAVAQAVIEGRLVELSAHGRMIGLRQSATDQPLVQGVDDAALRKMAMAAGAGFNAVRSEEELSSCAPASSVSRSMTAKASSIGSGVTGLRAGCVKRSGFGTTPISDASATTR